MVYIVLFYIATARKEDIVEHFSQHDYKSSFCFWAWLILGIILGTLVSYHERLCDVNRDSDTIWPVNMRILSIVRFRIIMDF